MVAPGIFNRLLVQEVAGEVLTQQELRLQQLHLVMAGMEEPAL